MENFCSLETDEHLPNRNIFFESGSLEVLKNLIKRNFGMTFIPGLMLNDMSKQEVKNHVRPFSHPIPSREISFVYRRDHWKLREIDALKQLIISNIPASIPLKAGRKMNILDIC
jgi:LysR family hydrogen peroxide-inducible transcriptional activator